MPDTNGKDNIEGKRAQRRKVEEPKQKQPEVTDEGCKSRKKQSNASLDVTVSRQGSRVECNGKENNFSPRRKAEEKLEKKRQESVSPDPAPVQGNKDESQDKADNSGRLPQKKQGKKKKKMSLGK